MQAKLWFAVAVLAMAALPAVAQEQPPTTQPTQPPPNQDVNVDIREENAPQGGGVSFADSTFLLVLIVIVALVLIAVAALAGHGPHH